MPDSVDTNVNVLPSGLALSTSLHIAEALTTDYTRSVTWDRTSDGAMVARILEFINGAGKEFWIDLFNPDDPDVDVGIHMSYEPSGAAFHQIGVVAEGPTAADQGQALLINALGQSSFLQLFTAAKARVQFGHLGAVNSDGGGWLVYTLPNAFPVAIDAVIAVNDGNGGSFAQTFQNTQTLNSSQFRCFVNAAGVNCSCVFFAIGH